MVEKEDLENKLKRKIKEDTIKTKKVELKSKERIKESGEFEKSGRGKEKAKVRKQLKDNKDKKVKKKNNVEKRIKVEGITQTIQETPVTASKGINLGGIEKSLGFSRVVESRPESEEALGIAVHRETTEDMRDYSRNYSQFQDIKYAQTTMYGESTEYGPQNYLGNTYGAYETQNTSTQANQDQVMEEMERLGRINLSGPEIVSPSEVMKQDSFVRERQVSVEELFLKPIGESYIKEEEKRRKKSISA